MAPPTRCRGKRGTRSQAVGRSRGGPSTKISVRVDALGNLVDFVPPPGRRHDWTGVAPLLAGVEFEALIADKAYDGNELRAELQAREATAVIPPRANRIDAIDYDRESTMTVRCTSGGTWWRISFVNSKPSVALPCASRRPTSATPP